MHRIAPYNNYSATRLRSNCGVTVIKQETGSRTTHAIEPLTINRNVRTGRSEVKDVVVHCIAMVYTYTRIH